MSSDLFIALVLGLAVGMCIVFVLPTIIAFRRQHPNRWAITVVNVFLGGSGIGWGVALIWALKAAHLSDRSTGEHGGESGLNLFANDVRKVQVIGDMRLALPGSHSGSQPSAPVIGDAARSIERLFALHQGGHVTDGEFAMMKADLLRRL